MKAHPETPMPRTLRTCSLFLAITFGFGLAHAQVPATPESAIPSPTAVPGPITEPQPATVTPAADNSALPQQAPDLDKDTAKAGKDKNKKDNDAPLPASEIHNPVLWHDPGNIAGLDLYYGQGGEKHMPTPPFVFLDEDHNGTNPKFDVRDANGKKWRVKLGEEARPEVVASRLLWAMGFYANDDYVLDDAAIQNIHIERGANRVKDSHVTDARFARKPGGENKIGIWRWKDNPFTGTRELNGLRVMMAVMNSWDLKDVNNAIYTDSKTGQQVFLMSDVGATFGTNGLSWTRARSKGNINSFKDSKFITRETGTEVDFATPKPPKAVLVETLGTDVHEYANRSGMGWIGQNIPRADARWMGSLLGQLSHQQLVDAFRAGHFPPDQIDAYVELVENRIMLLKQL
jgi:hypothetical protein